MRSSCAVVLIFLALLSSLVHESEGFSISSTPRLARLAHPHQGVQHAFSQRSAALPQQQLKLKHVNRLKHKIFSVPQGSAGAVSAAKIEQETTTCPAVPVPVPASVSVADVKKELLPPTVEVKKPLLPTNHATMSLLSALIGVATGFLVYYTKAAIFGMNRTILVQYPRLLPILGGLGMSLLIYLHPNAKKPPILPLTEHSQSSAQHELMWPQLLIRYLGAFFSIGGGAALGTAGVCAEIAMCCTYALFMTLNKFWVFDFTPAQQKMLLLSAAAAGAGANFNAPITGVLYASDFTNKLFAPGLGAVEAKDQENASKMQILMLAIASTLGVLVIRGGYIPSPIKGSLDWGRGLGFNYPPMKTLMVYSVLGFISGLLFKVYAAVRSKFAEFYEKLDNHLPPAVAGLLTAASATPQSIPAGFATANQIISNTISTSDAAKFFLQKFFLVSSAGVSGFIGGQIAPLIFTGSGFGFMFAKLLAKIAPDIVNGQYINSFGVICGAALVGCNFNNVLFPTVLIAEMTRSMEPALGTLLATTIAWLTMKTL